MLFYDLFTNMVMLMFKSKLTEADSTVSTDLSESKKMDAKVFCQTFNLMGPFKTFDHRTESQPAEARAREC